MVQAVCWNSAIILLFSNTYKPSIRATPPRCVKSYPSLKLTAISHVKIGKIPQNDHIPTIQFQVRTVGFREGTSKMSNTPVFGCTQQTLNLAVD